MCCRSGGRPGAASCRTTSSASSAAPTKPALAHAFINFMLDDAERVRQLRQLRRLHAAAERDRRQTLVTHGLIPESLEPAIVRPDAVPRQPGAPAADRRRASASGRRPGRSSGPARRGRAGLWRLLALPGVAWLTIFFLVAFYAVVCVAFGNQNTLAEPIPFWNPLDWNVGYVLETLRNIWHGGPVPHRLRCARSLFVAIALALSLLIGYPVAYYAARHAGRWKGVILLAADRCRSGSTT